jgi:hypothetical protein
MNKFKSLLLLSLITSNIAFANITLAQETNPAITLDETKEITKTDDQIKQKLAEIEELLNLVALKQLEDEKIVESKDVKNKNFAVKTKDLSFEAAKKLGKLISYVYNNSGKLLSKNTLVTVGVLAWPYFKMYPEHLIILSAAGSDFVVTLNGLIAEGILKGMVNNFEATTKILTLLSVKETGFALAQALGKLVVKALFGKL